MLDQQKEGEEEEEDVQTQEPPPKRARGKCQGRQQVKQEAPAVDDRISVLVQIGPSLFAEPLLCVCADRRGISESTKQNRGDCVARQGGGGGSEVAHQAFLWGILYSRWACLASSGNEAQAFAPCEFRDTLTEMLPSLGENLSSLEEAISCLDEIPQELSGYEGMAHLKLNMVKARSRWHR